MGEEVKWTPEKHAKFKEIVAKQRVEIDEALKEEDRQLERIAGKWRDLKVVPFKVQLPTVLTTSVSRRESSALRTEPTRAIVLSASRVAEAAEEAMRRLVELGEPIYQRDGMLVRPVQAGAGVVLVGLDEAYLKMTLSKQFRWQQPGSRKEIGPSNDVVGMVLAARGDWPFKRLDGVLNAPTLRRDGTLLDKPGYDEETCMLLAASALQVSIPPEPTREEAEGALDVLRELFEEFPFVDEASEGVALSLVLSTMARSALDAAPLHLFKAPEAGSGKSYIVNIASMIATGESCAVIAATSNVEEQEKRIAGAMMTGLPLISLDNLNGTLGSSLLCQAVTEKRVTQRPLGGSGLKIISNCSVFTANGNNIAIMDDLARRTVQGDLDAKIEKPWQREFRRNPLAMIEANRAKYVAAALTIPLAYLMSGERVQLAPVASFEGWSQFVREPLVWLGMTDPAVTMEAVRENDPKLQAKAAALHAIAAMFGCGKENAKTAADMIVPLSIKEEIEGNRRGAELREALMAVASAGKEISAKKLGTWLRDTRGQMAEGLRLEGERNRLNTMEWWVERA
ncbi:hypothetical protein G5V57_09530 [Nordella sp. HKS 07]|uniref:hypothetical protein n=1 Tax=Nordella sp. HKS 07 TaxID=2712222 RepID=UPI0013E123B5|nr:hypothetical protein [Nordella sp. HKS 07]QIG47935.1 hypothetical protein G5V57_09530 [Nordella sp. HKS 07]